MIWGQWCGINGEKPTGEANGYQTPMLNLLGGAPTEDMLKEILMAYVSEITICDGITDIGSGAFLGSVSLEKVTISSTVQEISNYAFFCSSVKDIAIPGSVTRIGTSAFEHSLIENLVIEEGVKQIGEKAFFFNHYIVRLSLPNSLTTIGKQAFENVDSIVNLVIPANVTTIGEEAFYFCGELTNVYIEYDPKVNKTSLSIGENVFNGAKNLTIYVRDKKVADALNGKIGDNVTNVTISTTYDWKAPEI